MATLNDPNTAANVARVGPVDTASGDASQHANLRPDDYGTLGHYRAHVFSGTMAAGAGALSEIVQVRYTGTNKCIVYSVVLDHFRSLATGFAAGNFLFDAIRSINWTGDGSGGGTQVPIKMRTSMAVPTATVRVATTAALGAGTKTLDAVALRAVRGIHNTAINSFQIVPSFTAANVNIGWYQPVPIFPAFGDVPQGGHPLVLAQNEGVSLRATVAGTGTWEFAATVLLSEVPNF